MAVPNIRNKRSSVPGKVPATTDLSFGEIGLNTYDGKVFISASNAVVGVGTTVITVNPWSVGIGSTAYNTYFNAGNVGIGTTNPTTKLYVAGDSYFTGILTANRIVSSVYGEFVGGSISGTNIVGTSLSVSGISTFSNGPVLIGTATSTGTASQPLQVTGGAYVSGNLGIGTTNPTYKFSVTGPNAIVTPGLTNVLADFTANIDSYSQVNTRNASNGTSASTDIIATADTGDNTTNYIDLGINNSGYSAVGWTINGPLDGYLYTSDTNLSIGAASASKYVSVFTGGTTAANERLRVTGTGNIGIGTTNPQGTLQVGTAITMYGSTGIISATSYYGDGSKLSGVSAASGDSYLFNTGVSSSFSATLVGIGSTVFTFPATAGKKYIVHSINCANVAAGNTEVNVIGAFDFNGGQRSYFAYNIPIPTGTSVEIMRQPQVMNPSDKIVMRSTDFTRVGTDSIIETYITYQEKTSTSYFGVGLGTVGLATTDSIGIYTSTTYPSVIQSIRLTNVTDSGAYPISVTVTTGLTTTRLIDNLIVPKYANVEILDTPKRIEANSIIKVQLDQGGTMGVQVSGNQITT